MTAGQHDDAALTGGQPPAGSWQPAGGWTSQQPYQPSPYPQGYPQQSYQQQSYQQQTYHQQPSVFPAQQYAPAATGFPLPPVWVPPVPVYPYAHWSRRVGGYLIDFAPAIIAQIPFWVGYVMFYVRLIQLASAPPGDPDELFAEFTSTPFVWMLVGVVLMLAAFGWQWYNRWLIGGRTGQSMGKRVVDTKLVAEVNGQPIGAVNAFLRDLLHTLDGIAYLGYLWPLWDTKRQTFADMIMKTVVVDLRVQQGAADGPGTHAQAPGSTA